MDTRVAVPESADSPAPGLRRAYVLALVLVMTPFVISAIAIATDTSPSPISDRALIELHVRDVGVHPVTVGLYSRDGWAHPGPMLFYLLAVPYRVFGSNMNALLIGSLVLNAAAVLAIAAIARRIVGIPFALFVIVGTSIVLRALGADFLQDPWVLYITVLPFGVLCLLTWAMASGRIWALPATAVVASYLAQTHVGYVAIALPPSLLGAIWLTLVVRREGAARVRALGRAAVASLGVLAVLWAPTAWNQWFGGKNLTVTVRWFRAAAEGTHTLAEGTRVVLAQLALVPDWVTGTRHGGLFNGETTLLRSAPVPLMLIAFVGAAILATRRHDRASGRLLAVLGFVVVTGVVASARTIGVMYDYRIQWTWMLGALIGVAIAWTVWGWITDRWPRAIAGLVPVVLVLLTALSVAESVDAATTDHTLSWLSQSPETATATAEAVSDLAPDAGEIVVTADSTVGDWYLHGAVLELERLGFDARVMADTGELYGSHRVWDRQPPQARLLILSGLDISRYDERPGWRLAGYAGMRPLAAEARASARNAAAQRRLVRSYRARRDQPLHLRPSDRRARRFRVAGSRHPARGRGLITSSSGDATIGHRADSRDRGTDHVAGRQHCARGHSDPVRCAGEDDVSGMERQDARQVLDEHRHGEDQLGGARLLAELAVHRAFQRDVVGILEGIRRDQHRTDRPERIAGLPEVEVRRHCRELQRAVRDVLAPGHPRDPAPCIGGRDVATPRADHDDQFGLVVHRVTHDAHVGVRCRDAARELGEHHRNRRHRHVRFSHVRAVVEPDAEAVLGCGDGRPQRRAGECAGGGDGGEIDVVESRERGDRGHRIGSQRTARRALEVVVVVLVDERGAAVDVGESEGHREPFLT